MLQSYGTGTNIKTYGANRHISFISINFSGNAYTCKHVSSYRRAGLLGCAPFENQLCNTGSDAVHHGTNGPFAVLFMQQGGPERLQPDDAWTTHAQ
jgi:hypothetical protein